MGPSHLTMLRLMGSANKLTKNRLGDLLLIELEAPEPKKMICNHPNGFSDASLGWKMWTTFQSQNFWTKFQSKKNWTKFLSKIFGTKIRSEILNEKRQSKNQSKICPKFFSSKLFCFFFWTDFGRSFGRLKKKSRNKFWTARKENLDGALGRTLGLPIGRVLTSNFENVFVFGILQRRSENFG